MPEEPGRPRGPSRGSRGLSRLPRERLGTIWACKMDPKSMKFEPRGEPRDQFAMLNGGTIDRIPASLEHRDVRRPSTESRDDPQEIPGSFQHPHHHQSRPSLTKMASGIFAKSQGSNDATTTILARAQDGEDTNNKRRTAYGERPGGMREAIK